jgi:hypothetical protein
VPSPHVCVGVTAGVHLPRLLFILLTLGSGGYGSDLRA